MASNKMVTPPDDYKGEEIRNAIVSTLFPFIENKENQVVKEFFKKHPKSMIVYSNARQSALHVATKAKNYEIMHFLLKYVPQRVRMPNGDSFIDCRDECGDSALMEAVKAQDLKAMRLILNHYPNFDVTEYETNQKAIHLAAETGNVAVMKTLLFAKWKMGMALNVDEPVEKTGLTPLHLAAKAGKLDMVRYLIKQKADVNKITLQAGRTALMLAAGNRQMDVFNYLSSLPQADKDIADKYGKKIDYFLDPKNHLNENEDAFERLVEETAYLDEAEAEKIFDQFLEEKNECPVIVEARKYSLSKQKVRE